MARKLTVVTEQTAAKSKAKKPATIKAALDMTERELLVALREKAAAEIDSGVPAHTLPGMMKHLRELDKEIRAIDAREDDDGGDDGPEVEDGTFDASAV